MEIENGGLELKSEFYKNILKYFKTTFVFTKKKFTVWKVH